MEVVIFCEGKRRWRGAHGDVPYVSVTRGAQMSSHFESPSLYLKALLHTKRTVQSVQKLFSKWNFTFKVNSSVSVSSIFFYFSG